MKHRLSVILLLIIMLTISVNAQTGRISGNVTDANKLVLAGANVYIDELSKGAATDQQGNFDILQVKPGTYTLTVSYIGFQKQALDVKVEANKTTYIEVMLNPGIVEGDEVVIIGERLQGQAKALNQQMNNDNITNVVSSDQIGRFPDQNIGDALKRIPAITVNYDQGEARFVNIRGTEPRLNSVMINGERVPSAEAEIRNVQVDLIPSDMIQTIEVNKALTPDMDADAIGGSINLITRSAPSGLRISGTLGGGYNFLSDKGIYNGAVVLGNRFFDDKLGAVISGSFYDHNLGSDNTEGEWDEDDGVIYPAEWDVREYRIRRLRKSAAGSFDYRLADGSNLFLRAMYNHRNDWENRYRLTYKVEDDEMERQTKAGINNDDNDNARLEDQRTYTISLGGDHVLFNAVKMNWSAAYSKASEERPNERYITFKIEDVPIAYDISDPEKPYFSTSSSAVNDFSNWELDELTEEYQYTEEKDFDVRLDLEIPISEGVNKNSLKIGGKFRNKDKDRENKFFEYEPIDGFETLADVQRADFSDPDFLAGDYLVGEFASKEFLGSLDLTNSSLFEEEDKPDEYAADNFTANEKVYAGYAMWTQDFGPQWKVIAGVRIENTDIDYEGNEFDEDTEEITPTSGNDSYVNILPGIHVNYRYNTNTVFRFAWTNTLARPNYYDLVPYRIVTQEDGELEIGNPALEPTTSMNFDFMAEHYFKNVGILSGGVFFKSINDFIYEYNEDDYYDAISDTTYELTQPRNGAEATLLGFEFSFQRRLDFLPGILQNLNFYSNYTYTYSNADNPVLNEQVEGDEDIELPGTAPHTLNTALTYQDQKLVLSVTFNYSSSYLDPDELDLTPGLERYYDAVTYLDVTGSFAVTPQLRFFFEANNLLNQPLRYYAGESDRTYQAEYYSSRITAGFKFDL